MEAKKKVIFVVDDEPITTRSLTLILNHAGYEAHPFGHASQAIAGITDFVPDLLITDMSMPEMTGIDLAVRFQKELPRCKILLLTGLTADGLADPLEKAQVEGYTFTVLSKPTHPSELLAKVRACFDQADSK